MGISHSIEKSVEHKVETIKDFQFRQLAIQREVQIAVNMAMARDQLQYFGSVWTGIATIGAAATVKTGQFPKPLAIPLVVIGIVSTYFADQAYGTKMIRVAKEAEHIMNNERYRFIPPEKAPFSYVYDDERVQYADVLARSHRVGDWWPSFMKPWL